jgi:hypothetical protein
MEKNLLEKFTPSHTIETTDEELAEFLDIIARNGKLETFFKVLDLLIDDKVNDDIVINMDDIKNTMNDIENGLEVKTN